MQLRYNRFEGMAPRVDPAGLAEGLAVNAVNAGFSRGVLSCLALDFKEITENNFIGSAVGSLTRANGMFYSHSANAWFLFSGEVSNGVDSLIAPQDEYDRIYFADSTGPRFMVSDQYSKDTTNINRNSYRLGVPYPDLSPTASRESESLPSDVEPTEVQRQRVSYVFTIVDQFGHEGPPSPPSNAVEIPIEYGFSVSLTLGLGGVSTNGVALGSGAKKYIYRSTQGTSEAAYQYVGQTNFTATSFTDSAEYGEEAEVIPSTYWYSPPAEIKHIDAVASNFLAGFYGNMLCFSEVKLPHAWPSEYRFPLKYQVVGVKSTANGLFVGTTGKPYWCYGADPQAAIPQEMDEDYPCVNPRSIVDAGGFIVYASHDGLVATDGQTMRLLTEELFDRIDWQAMDPYNMRVWAYENRVIFYAPGDEAIYAIEPGSARTLTKLDAGIPANLFASVSAVGRDMRHDRTILALSDFTTSVKFLEMINAVDAVTAWDSREELTPPATFSYIQAMATTYPVTVTLYSDRNHAHTIVLENEKPQRLPPLAKSRRWSAGISFRGNNIQDGVESVVICQNSGELIHVA